ncbi:MAG: PD-(D/E)XK nuclease family protein [Gemmatimonadetes bacterium]|nr:PD-(D/E)XK nuclease family protein [Gemmatimonadota bacterium]
MTRLSLSHLRTHQTCVRQWWFTYIEGWVVESSGGAAHLGSLVHDGLADYYKTGDPWEAISTAEAEALEQDDADALSAVSKAVTILEAYVEDDDIVIDDEALEVEDVEIELSADAQACRDIFGHRWPEGASMLGYADAVGTHNGKPFLMEHKTTAMTYATWVHSDLPKLRQQAAVYALLYDSDDPPPVLVNVLRTHCGERAAQPHRWRYWLRWSKASIERQAANIAHSARRAVADRADVWAPHDPPPPSFGMHCSMCAFKAVCPTFDQGVMYDYTGMMSEFYGKREER